jgi:hypothetical protein
VEIYRNANPKIVPYEVKWKIHKESLYLGESIAAVLMIDELTEIIFPESISLVSLKGGVFEEVQGIGKINRERAGDVELYGIPVAAYMFTPTQTGNVILPKAEVTLYGLSIQAMERVIQVKELPKAVNTSGAVGDLKFSSAISGRSVRMGENIEVQMRAEGEGNLLYLQFPQPVTESLIETSRSEDQVVTPGVTGFRGFRTVTYVFTPEKEGDAVISIPSFVWVNSDDGTVHRTPEQQYRISITASGDEVLVEEDFPFDILSAERIKSHNPADAYMNPWSYLWILPGIGMLVFSILRKKYAVITVLIPLCFFFISADTQPERGAFPLSELERAEAAYTAGDISEAAGAYEEALLIQEDSPGIWYNLSLAYFRMGRHGAAVYSLRNAIRMNPMVQVYWDTLQWMEESLELFRQVEPERWIHPDIFLIILAVFFNITCGLIAVSLYRKKSIYVITAILGLILTAASLSLLIYTGTAGKYGAGIINNETASLRKIPETDAEKWLVLDEGTAISVKTRTDGFYLVETRFGIEGWLEEDSFFWGKKDIIPWGETENEEQL